MNKIIVPIFLLMFSFFESKAQTKSNTSQIPLEKIEEMFSNMKANGVNTDTKLLWGYYFVANDQKVLQDIAGELKAKEFRFVEIFQREDKDFWLHLERVEVHNSKSLFKLDKDLYAVADKYKVKYDGFDVGNPDPTKPIERDTYAVPEEFQTLDYQKDGYPCFLIGNTAFDRFPHKEEFCYFIKVTAAYEMNDNTLLPTSKELDALNELEILIGNELSQKNIKNYYVYRETHKGTRNFYIVTNDSTGAGEVLKSIKKSGKQRQFDYTISTDKDWNVYKEFRTKIP